MTVDVLGSAVVTADDVAAVSWADADNPAYNPNKISSVLIGPDPGQRRADTKWITPLVTMPHPTEQIRDDDLLLIGVARALGRYHRVTPRARQGVILLAGEIVTRVLYESLVAEHGSAALYPLRWTLEQMWPTPGTPALSAPPRDIHRPRSRGCCPDPARSRWTPGAAGPSRS